jgi:hypothetical protein
MTTSPTRRKIILGGAVAASGLALGEDLLAQGYLTPTPACGGVATLAQTEGRSSVQTPLNGSRCSNQA